MLEYPKVIYKTPDGWGDTTEYLDEERLRETVADLRKLGAEWETTSAEEATPWDFVKTVPWREGVAAVYSTATGQTGRYRTVYIVLEATEIEGFFDFAEGEAFSLGELLM